MDITSVLPQPTAVRLGGVEYDLLPLRLEEVAQLQRFAAAAVPCPLSPEVRARLDDPATPRPERRRLLRETWRACKAWPPRYGSPAADAAFRSPAGRLFFLGLLLRSSGVEIELPDLVALAGSLLPGELAHAAVVAFGGRPMEELNRRVAIELGESIEDDDDEDDPDQGDLNWAEAFARTAEATGWTFEEIGRLRIPQWRAIRSGGRGKLPVLDPSHEALVRRCRFLDGELDDEPETGVADGG